jgi:hypothetical protein
LPFRAAPLRVEDPSHGALLTAFLSSLSLDESQAVRFCLALRSAISCIGWNCMGSRSARSTIGPVREASVPVPPVFGAAASYKADIAARVRRFVRLEDQGYVEVDDGIDDLPRHLADYSDAIDRLQLAQGPAQPIDPRPSISRPGFALRDDNGPISTTRSSTSTRA